MPWETHPSRGDCGEDGVGVVVVGGSCLPALRPLFGSALPISPGISLNTAPSIQSTPWWGGGDPARHLRPSRVPRQEPCQLAPPAEPPSFLPQA